MRSSGSRLVILGRMMRFFLRRKMRRGRLLLRNLLRSMGRGLGGVGTRVLGGILWRSVSGVRGWHLHLKAWFVIVKVWGTKAFSARTLGSGFEDLKMRFRSSN